METGRPLTILSLATEWHSGHGGISTFNRELCSALARLGHKVFCGVPTIIAAEEAAANARNVQLVAPKPVPGISDVGALLRPFVGVEGVDVVIGHGRITGSAAVAQVKDRFRYARYVHFFHMDPNAIEFEKEVDPDSDATTKAEQRCDLEVELSRNADLAVAVGPVLHAAYEMYLRPYRRRAHLFMPGLFESRWTPPPVYGAISCLLFGRAEDAELKGLTIAASAIGEVCGPAGPFGLARLVVRGARPDQGDQLQKELKRASGGVAHVVVQRYSDDVCKIQTEIRRASLVLMPSQYEGFGLSGLEAISEGIPVLLGHRSGLAQALLAHVPEVADIHIVDVSRGSSALAGRIRERLSDLNGSFESALALREAMRPHFDWGASARKMIEALDREQSPPSQDGSDVPVVGSKLSATVALADALAFASSALFAWRQTLCTTNQWIDRPELGAMFQSVRDETAKPLILLGPPGSGKSALMARCAKELRASGFAVLGIKADALPNTVDSLAALAAHLDLPADITTGIATVAALQPTVLFVDQLDALADLVDLRTARLSVLLALVTSAVDAGVRVVLSCREFDFAHDVRFRQLYAQELRLELPASEAVVEILAANGIDPNGLTPRLREVIRSPHLLDAFLEVRKGGSVAVADTQQQILGELWRSRLGHSIEAGATGTAAEGIAILMGEREELWLSRESLASKGLLSHLSHLLHSGLVIEERERISFAHQTMFEYARARAFASSGESLTEHVHRRQDTLFVRPTLWTSLEYLRSTAPGAYVRELENLWSSPKTRAHVRRLLWDFLGQRTDPTEQEFTLVAEGLGAEAFRRTAINAITGNPAWFERLRGVLSPLLVEDDGSMVIGVMVNAAQFAPTEATELMERSWRGDATKLRSMATVLALAKNWSERTEALALDAIRRDGVDQHLANSLISQAIQERPDAAPRLMVAYLERKHAELGVLADVDRGEDTVQRFFANRERLTPVRNLFERCGGLHSAPEAAKAAPGSFLASVWPWFVRVVRELADDEWCDPAVKTYRDDSLGTSGRYAYARQGLPAAIEVAIHTLGSNDAAAMVRFVEAWQAEETLAVHRFLMAGLRAALPASAAFSTEYLLGDERRLLVGSWQRESSDAIELIEALAPYLDSSSIASLEEMMLRSSCAPENHEEVESRRRARDMNRRHRLCLLRALGVDRLSAGSRAQVEQEVRRFSEPPEARRAAGTPVAREAPVTSEQMLRAKNRDILNLFCELHDATEWQHPSRPMEGGSVQASRELAKATKEDPERFAALLHFFEPGVTERPVAEAFAALGEVFPLGRMEDKLHALVAAGFFGGEYREEAAWGLRRALRDGATLRPDTSALLKSWLVDYPEADESQPSESSGDGPLLFGMHGGGFLPGGNYPILLVLTLSCLGRSEPDVDAWLTVLEEHLGRRERSAVWEVLSRHLEYVLLGPADRATVLLSRIFEQFPRVRDSREGLAIVARATHRLREATIARWVADLEKGAWNKRTQAAGELLGLLVARSSPSSWAQARVDAELHSFAAGGASREFVLGLTYAAAYAWGVPERRSAANRVLLRVVPYASGAISSAVIDAFRSVRRLRWDVETQSLLSALRDNPQVLAADKAHSFLDRLRELLPAGANAEVAGEREHLVADVTLALASQLLKVEPHGRLVPYGRELADISLTLQRLNPATRSKGLDLFELLLEQNAFGIHDVLAELDDLDSSRAASRRGRFGRGGRDRSSSST